MAKTSLRHSCGKGEEEKWMGEWGGVGGAKAFREIQKKISCTGKTYADKKADDGGVGSSSARGQKDIRQQRPEKRGPNTPHQPCDVDFGFQGGGV